MIQDDGNLFAVVGHPNAPWLTWLGLRSMRHRARGGAGIVSSDGAVIRGVWKESLTCPDLDLDEIRGVMAMGRLSGAPAVDLDAALVPEEPVCRWWRRGQLAVMTAGRLTNGAVLRKRLLEDAHALAGTSDAEIIAGLLAQGRGSSVVSSVVHELFDLHGAYNLVVMTTDLLVACRDPRGFRPLYVGRHEGAVMLASESSALRDVGADAIREIEPGEVFVVGHGRTDSLRPFLRGEWPRAASLMDLVRLARPSSEVAGERVHLARMRLGRELAAEHPVGEECTVVALSDAIEVGQGFASASGLDLAAVIESNDDEAPPWLPPLGMTKLGAIAPQRVNGVPGPEVCLVVPLLATEAELDPAVDALRRAGVRTLHVRIASPPVVTGEPFGLAFPPKDLLLASRASTADGQCRALGVDSIEFLSLDGFRRAIRSWDSGWCDTPWSTQLPIPSDVPDDQLELGFSKAAAG